ncbi:MAG: hypothetical protein HYX84_05635 [Chloroflexi bacterium]|nr:hypothetical protein [Chloroflexota bacterium]
MAVQNREKATTGMHRIKELEPAILSRLQNLEKQLGCCIVAVEPRFPVARLTQEQLGELQALEKEMKAILIAYAC